MKKEWQEKKLGDVCDIQLGKTPLRGNKKFWDQNKTTKNVWLSIADLSNAHGKIVSESKEYLSEEGAKVSKIVKEETLLVSFKLTLGRLAFAGRDLYTNEAIAALTIKSENELSKDYLYYFLTYFDWGAAAEGDVKVKGKTLNKEKLKKIKVRFPDLKEQQRIVSLLSKTFEALDKAKNRTEKSYENASSLFDSYLQGVFAKKENGWRRVSIEEVCESIIDCINKTAPTVQEPTPYKMIRTSNVKNGKINLNSVKFVTQDTFNLWTRRQVPRQGDVLLTREAPLGEVGIIQTDDHVFLGQRIVSYRVDTSILDNNYLLYAFQSKDVQQQIQSLASGSTVLHMRVPDSKKLQLNLPSLTEQRSIVKKLNSFLAETQRLEAIYQQKLTNLDDLKKSILNKAFNGEL
ncbi:restriction endonuclease subunit S [Alkalihalobacillus sp. AL-G]|uniref:restriction endonuclease subunit S n=1 Tax=Alkalihalobacillus sp. AL-G TaxID=2926399 RepID=UPI00272CAB66|nr:restriction endonuclease subunit S [Alkalihalobacillus sp. AL-G]WLD93357.1 restriction endonuclease subunit S [Alkalihalobacillus sp. AL-G]